MSFLDDLDTSVLEGMIPDGSKSAKLVTCTIEGLVQAEELAEYVERVAAGDLPGAKSQDVDIQKIRARHHAVARLLATGIPEGVVATITRFSASRVSQLKNSPAMQELIAHYRGPSNEAAQALTEKLKILGDQASEELMDRLLERPDELSAADLIAISKLGLDRSGHGPASSLKVDNVTQVVDHAELLRLRAGVRAAEQGRISKPAQPLLPAPRDEEAA